MPPGFLSLAGQPLLLYAILNLRRSRASVFNWCVIVLFPFYSSLVLIGYAIAFVLCMIVGYDWYFTRKINLAMVGALILMVIFYCVAEYRVLYQIFFDDGYTSHRVEFQRNDMSLDEAWHAGRSRFVLGHQHAASSQYPIILSAAALALALVMCMFAGVRKEVETLPRMLD